MENETIASKIVEFATEETNDLSDVDYMEVYFDVAEQLRSMAEIKQEELDRE